MQIPENKGKSLEEKCTMKMQNSNKVNNSIYTTDLREYSKILISIV